VEFYVALNCENLPRQLVLSIELSDDIWWYGFRPSGTAIPVRVLRLQRRLEDPVNPRKIAFPSSFPLAPMLFFVGPHKLIPKEPWPWNGLPLSTKRLTSTAKSARTPTPSSNPSLNAR